MQRFDIAISGASLAGLALARALALSLGPTCRIALIERTPLAATRSPDPRAFALAAATRNLLTAIGVWPDIAHVACTVAAIDITDSSLDHAIRPVLLSYDNVVDGKPASVIVPADDLRRALAAIVAATPAITQLRPVCVTGYTTGPAGVSVQTEGGAEITASLLVATDGRRSALREAAGIETIGWAHEQIGIAATIAHELPHKGRAVQHFLPGGPFAILPLVGDRSCITWSEEAKRGRAILAMDDAGFLAEVELRVGHRLGALALAGPRAGWPLELHVARNFVADRFALTGDAARAVHPIAGQGLNLGLRDVAALVDVVADAVRVGLDPGDATALERYARWRRFDSGLAAAGFEVLNGLFSNDSTLLRAIRDAGLGVVDRLPELKGLLVAEAAGLSGDVPRLLRGVVP